MEVPPDPVRGTSTKSVSAPKHPELSHCYMTPQDPTPRGKQLLLEAGLQTTHSADQAGPQPGQARGAHEHGVTTNSYRAFSTWPSVVLSASQRTGNRRARQSGASARRTHKSNPTCCPSRPNRKLPGAGYATAAAAPSPRPAHAGLGALHPVGSPGSASLEHTSHQGSRARKDRPDAVLGLLWKTLPEKVRCPPHDRSTPFSTGRKRRKPRGTAW